MRMSAPGWIRAGTALVLGTILVMGWPSGHSIAGAPLVKVRWSTIIFASQSYIPTIIKQRRLDVKYGLDLTIVPLSTALQQWTSLRSGDADVSSGSILDLLRQRKAGLRAKAFMNFLGVSDFSNPIVAPADRSYARIADLRGLRVGTPSRTLFAWLIYRAAGMKAEGIDLERDTRQVVESSPPLLHQLMAKGDLDAAVQFSSVILGPLAKGQVKVVISLPNAMIRAGFDRDAFYLVWIATEAWIKNHPGALARLIAAMQDAQEILATDDSVWTQLAAQSGVTDPDLLPFFMRVNREEMSRGKFLPVKVVSTQRLLDSIIHVAGADVVGAAKVELEAFDFRAVEDARKHRRR